MKHAGVALTHKLGVMCAVHCAAICDACSQIDVLLVERVALGQQRGRQDAKAGRASKRELLVVGFALDCGRVQNCASSPTPTCQLARVTLVCLGGGGAHAPRNVLGCIGCKGHATQLVGHLHRCHKRLCRHHVVRGLGRQADLRSASESPEWPSWAFASAAELRARFFVLLSRRRPVQGIRNDSPAPRAPRRQALRQSAACPRSAGESSWLRRSHSETGEELPTRVPAQQWQSQHVEPCSAAASLLIAVIPEAVIRQEAMLECLHSRWPHDSLLPRPGYSLRTEQCRC